MGNHAAPRSPSRRRALVLGVASILGLAATVAVGVFVAPDPAPSPLGLHWPTPTTSTPAPSTAPANPFAPRPGDLLAEAQQRAAELAAAKAAEDLAAKAEADRVAAEQAQAQADAEAAQQAQEAAEQAQRAEAAAASEAAQQAAPAPPPPTPTPTSSDPAPAGDLRAYALQLLGGDAVQMAALEKLWGRESGWNPDAQNPTSTAFGIAQFLDSTWATVGVQKTSDPYIQIQAGLAYIQARYGSPTAAWAHSVETGWY